MSVLLISALDPNHNQIEFLCNLPAKTVSNRYNCKILYSNQYFQLHRIFPTTSAKPPTLFSHKRSFKFTTHCLLITTRFCTDLPQNAIAEQLPRIYLSTNWQVHGKTFGLYYKHFTLSLGLSDWLAGWLAGYLYCRVSICLCSTTAIHVRSVVFSSSIDNKLILATPPVHLSYETTAPRNPINEDLLSKSHTNTPN